MTQFILRLNLLNVPDSCIYVYIHFGIISNIHFGIISTNMKTLMIFTVAVVLLDLKTPRF